METIIHNSNDTELVSNLFLLVSILNHNNVFKLVIELIFNCLFSYIKSILCKVYNNMSSNALLFLL